ncbi:MAG: hypothetical protein HZB53_07015 [Chloroflexi bacterium]|nr:hypothetical protein [Chloroflexota bacterium]
MDELIGVVDYNLRTFRGRYPIDVTDQVFVAIETNPSQLRLYKSAVKEKGQDVVNKRIGKLVKKLTGLNNLGRCNSPRSKLIKSYEKHG